MNEKQAASWQKKRAMGKPKYVLMYGALAWGISLTIIFSLLEFFSQGAVNSGWVIARLIVFGFIGLFIANFKWNAAERKQGDRS